MMVTNAIKKSTTTTTYDLDDEGNVLKETTVRVVEEPTVYPEPTISVMSCDDYTTDEGELLEGEVELTAHTPFVKTLLATLAGAFVGTLVGRSVCKILEEN